MTQPTHKKPVPMDGLVVVIDDYYQLSVDKFVEYYPEFANLQQTAISVTGDTAVSMLSVCNFGRMFQYAVGLLTAHRLAQLFDLSAEYDNEGKRDQATTEIGTSLSASTSSLSEGSSPLALVNSDDPFVSDLAQTKYGLQLLALIRMWIPGTSVVTGQSLGSGFYGGQWPPPNSGY